LVGPVFVLPYKLTYSVKEKIASKGKFQKEIIKEVTTEDKLYIIPKQLTVNSKLESSMRYRGIYGIPIYTSNLEINGEFNF
jgi:inner membrane protein